MLKSKSFETREELEAFDFQPVCEQYCENLKEIRLMEKTIRKHVLSKKTVGFNDEGIVVEDIENTENTESEEAAE